MSGIDDRRPEASDEALMQFARERLRAAESGVDSMTAVRLAAARRRALDAVPRRGTLSALVPVGGALGMHRRAWLAAPSLALVAALAVLSWSPWQGGNRVQPSPETLEWLAQEQRAPMPPDLYEDLDLVMWLDDMDGSV